jgi:DNA-binding NarL/FixJ family response regulator
MPLHQRHVAICGMQHEPSGYCSLGGREALDCPSVLLAGPRVMRKRVLKRLPLRADSGFVEVAKRDEILDRYRARVGEFDRTASARARRGAVTVLPSSVPAPELRSTLTTREAEVLQLLANGLSNLEIARRLVITQETAKTHVGHLLRKMEAHSRAHAVAVGFRHNLLI